jgi:mevalonate kinase
MPDQNRILELTKNTKLEFPLSQFPTRQYYGHGKLMFTGEYVSLLGAKVLAIPTKLGQMMVVRTRSSNSPVLHWRGIDCEGKIWFSAKFELWHFNLIDEPALEADQIPIMDPDKVYYLQKLLSSARSINPHFLRDEEDVFVETRLEFPLHWGLGSSSSLIYNVAQWAYISPFKLSATMSSGSHYDIACAQSNGPIVYQLDLMSDEPTPTWQSVTFNPNFKEHLYFLYRGNKKDTQVEIQRFRNLEHSAEFIKKVVKDISGITATMLEVESFNQFCHLIDTHEEIIASAIDQPPLKMKYYPDFEGSIKSLGAWGGDFALVATRLAYDQVKNYFIKDDKTILLTYDMLFKGNDKELYH